MKTARLYTLIATAMIAYSPVAIAADANTIAVVNIQRIMRESAPPRNRCANSWKPSKKGLPGGDITKREDSLRKEDQELSKQRSILSKEAFEKKAAEFRKKATDVQKEVQSKKAMLDSGFEHALNDIQKVVTEIIAAMSKDKGFVVALPTSQILYSDSKLDITSDVLTALNKKLPKLDVKFDEAPAADAKPDAK